jgi:hypothetical protein
MIARRYGAFSGAFSRANRSDRRRSGVFWTVPVSAAQTHEGEWRFLRCRVFGVRGSV